jgi:hypothetical protein
MYFKMKSVFLICSIILISNNYVFAQSVAINTDGSTANTSALLDVKSTTKGILIPRMSKAEKNSIAAPATGLLIFQNAPDSIGFYYYSGSTWLWLANTAQQDTAAWKTIGNSGTTVANHFFGTRDNVPLSFRQNNLWLGRWNSSTSNYFIGDSAGIVTTGISNIAIGKNAMQKNTTAFGNVAVGNNALQNNTAGRRNTAIGDSALFEQSNAPFLSTDNTAIGNSAMRFTNPTSSSNGIKNVAIGNDAMYSNTTGEENVAVGVSAMRENLTGGGNVAVGRSAYRHAKEGAGNSYIGYATGFSDSLGSLNAGFGPYALYTHQTGDHNIAVGSYAMQYDSSGNRNVAIGSFASRNNDTAKLNVGIGYAALNNNKRNTITAIGAYAGMNNGTGSGNANDGIENTAIGYAAMSGNSNGSQNTALGYKAMSLTEPLAYIAGAAPSRNIAIGDSAMRRNLANDNIGIGFRTLGGALLSATAGANTAIGSNAMFGNTGGEKNIAIGYETLLSNTNGDHNTAVGTTALRSNTIGNKNVAVGISSLRSNTTASGNVAIGDSALYIQSYSNSNTEYATRNTAVGSFALYSNQPTAAAFTGTLNAAIGAYSLWQNTSGHSNTAVGSFAGSSITTGTGNVAVGTFSLNNTSISALNTGVGQQAGENNTFGSENTFVGALSDCSSGSLSNATAIGTRAYVTQNNSLILGGITGINSGTNTNVGIGTTAPAARLDVDANFKLGANGTILSEIIKSTETYDIPSLAPGAVDIQTLAVANATLGSVVSISPLFALPDGITISYARVSAAGSVEVKVVNAGTATQNPSSMSFILALIR